jgi:peptidoglycan hydrolase-like protein with peptidoglycan-binding domain
MPFTLSRGGRNVIAEVQRWQCFLLRMSVPQVGGIDGDFGLKTETATKIFQMQSGLTQTGKLDVATIDKARTLGYTVVADDYYRLRQGDGFPAIPGGLQSPGNATRNRDFTCFHFLQRPLANRPDPEAIVIRDSCDGRLPDWTAAQIIEIPMPQLRFATGFRGTVRCHRRAAGQIARLFEAWERADLLHLIRSYAGCFVPRYKRRLAPPGASGHGVKESIGVADLSNHSFGSAFDINAEDNPLGAVPAMCGARGATRELVAAANAEGIFWGGHFTRRDGMHFELAEVRGG